MRYLNTSDSAELLEMTTNGSLYVDKSMLIDRISQKIRTEERFICITRPRRFGKSVNAHMLAAYYTKNQNTHELFANLKIAETAGYRKHLNQHNVIFIDFSKMPDLCESCREYMKFIIENMRADLQEAYPELSKREYASLSEMLNATGERFIFILDEWNAIFHENYITEADKAKYLNFLRNLLKDQPYVELAYMTGVLPIVKYSSGSALNMFDEFDFLTDNVYDKYFGFDEDEVRELCRQYPELSYEEIKYWYDGYYNSQGKSLFNPRSVRSALSRGKCSNYWTSTGPMDEIADCIERNIDEVREDIVKLVAGIPIRIRLDSYRATDISLDSREEILSAMVVYGFLSYHQETVKIPNQELMEKFEEVLSRKSMGEVKKIVDRSQDILKATLAHDEETLAAFIEEVHDREIPFLKYNDENALSCVITLCYLAARDTYRVERETKSGKGFCDYLFYPRRKGDPAIILELKVDGSCEEAIAQIRNRGYVEKVEDCGEVLLVGINYDRKEKKHRCRIENY